MLERIGGPDRDRTDDLFHAMEARSQLRHRPTCYEVATSLLSPLEPHSSNIVPRSKAQLQTATGLWHHALTHNEFAPVGHWTWAGWPLSVRFTNLSCV